MPKATSLIADELANKVKYLHLALDQANSIIRTLENENSRIKNVINDLENIQNKQTTENPVEFCEA